METSQSIIYWGVALCMLVFIMLAGGVVFFNYRYQKSILKKQKELHRKESEYKTALIKNTITSTESERKRIAGDLHDEIGSQLTTIRMLLNAILKEQPGSSKVEESKQILDNTISSVRTISHNLIPPTLERFGLINTIEDLCRSIDGTGITIQFIYSGDFSVVTKERELAIFRIIQELLTNSSRHGFANRIHLLFSIDDNLFRIEYADNGKGIDASLLTISKGLGLMNIESRVMAQYGSVKFTSEINKGFSAIIELPVIG